MIARNQILYSRAKWHGRPARESRARCACHKYGKHEFGINRPTYTKGLLKMRGKLRVRSNVNERELLVHGITTRRSGRGFRSGLPLPGLPC